MTEYTHYHGRYFAHRIMLHGRNDEAFAKSLSTARVDMKPHQVEAARFALHSPLSKGVILADEVGLGKTIEACLVIAQKWAERRRHVLLIVPASLRTQWQQELQQKFSLPSVILDSKTYRDAEKSGQRQPFDNPAAVVITSYQYAARKHDELHRIAWDLVVIDEAHRLRNVYKKRQSAQAKKLRDVLASRFKIMLTATPLQNSLMELYGLVSVIDDSFFGDEQSFRGMYGRTTDKLALQSLRRRLSPIYKRHLRRDVQQAGHVSYTKRIAVTFDFEPHDREAQLYEGVSEYLQRGDSIGFGAKPNQLVLIGARKTLGSSIAAIILFLENVIARLHKSKVADVSVIDDIDDTAEVGEEIADDAMLSADANVQSCRGETAVQEAFEKLEAELEEQIKADMAETRQQLFDMFDASIVDVLRQRATDIERTMSDFERRLWLVARAELPTAKFHSDGIARFEHDGKTWSTVWPEADERGWQFFRLGDGTLADRLIEGACQRDLPEAKLVFDYKAYRSEGMPRLSDVEQVSGKAGWLKVSVLRAETALGSRDSIVLAATTDEGSVLAKETAERLFQLPATTGAIDAAYPAKTMAAIDGQALKEAQQEAENQSRNWLDEETVKLEAYAEDLESANKRREKELKAEADSAKRALRGNQSIPLAEKIEEERRIKKLEQERDDLVLGSFKKLRDIRREIDDKLNEVAAKLAITPVITPLMTIRWELTE